ncbi:MULTISPECIES: hypothetical protein [Larkinella]|jgi:hypothetical protein|uniref:Uncharacterized protein n=1 Tax=Larkinella humicola TaxID=2607654 RepID=A0A5N1JL06_9BACT|nr:MULTISPECIES: hypothetical protein [Larkinella]KAA9356854.1 hypothetical protein F0P93_03685 [Larkinella humicola]
MSPELTLSQAEVFHLHKRLSEIKTETGNPSILDDVFEKLETFVKSYIPAPTSDSAIIFSSIPVYQNESDEIPEKGIPGVHILSIARRFPKWVDHFITWGLDTAGLPSGFVALPFQYSGDVDGALRDGNSYSAIRQESLFVLIIRTSGIRDAEHFRTAYDQICEYYRQRYKLVPALDASDINTRLRVGHDPSIKQDFTRPIIPFEDLKFPLDSVIQPNEMSNDILILKVNALIQEGKSQRKIGQELGIPQPRISRLIAKSKE